MVTATYLTTRWPDHRHLSPTTTRPHLSLLPTPAIYSPPPTASVLTPSFHASLPPPLSPYSPQHRHHPRRRSLLPSNAPSPSPKPHHFSHCSHSPPSTESLSHSSSAPSLSEAVPHAPVFGSSFRCTCSQAYARPSNTHHASIINNSFFKPALKNALHQQQWTTENEKLSKQTIGKQQQTGCAQSQPISSVQRLVRFLTFEISISE